MTPITKRIGLSRRRRLRDPWDEIATSMRRGQLVKGQVTKLTKFGAFAKLVDNPAVEGLIHISELSSERVTHPREVVKRGDELALRIVKIDVKERRLGLSLKSVNSTEYLDLDWEMAILDSANLPEEEPVAELVETAPVEEEVVEQAIEDATETAPESGVETEAVVEPTEDQADAHAVVSEEAVEETEAPAEETDASEEAPVEESED